MTYLFASLAGLLAAWTIALVLNARRNRPRLRHPVGVLAPERSVREYWDRRETFEANVRANAHPTKPVLAAVVDRTCPVCNGAFTVHPAIVEPRCPACWKKAFAQDEEKMREFWASQGWDKEPPKGAA